MSKWIEQGECTQRPGETLVAIEQEDFGIVCAILDYEGESVYRILRAMNAYDAMLAALKSIAGHTSNAIVRNKQERPSSLLDLHSTVIGAQITARNAIEAAEKA